MNHLTQRLLIISEIYKSFVLLGAEHDLLSTIGSWGDSLSDADVVSGLKAWNEATLKEIKGRIEHYEISSRPLTAIPLASFSVSTLNVPAGKSSRPVANFLHRLAAPRRWWNRSMLPRLVEEICSLPPRIRATAIQYAAKVQPRIALSWKLPIPPQGLELFEFSEVCSADILKLQEENPWMGCLDLQMAAEAYARGVAYGIDKQSNGTCKEA
jgi:hypothetical protein